jgi:hypothetical protein
LKNECARKTPERGPEPRHDYLAVFREFLDHLDRIARRDAPVPAKDRHSRIGGR